MGLLSELLLNTGDYNRHDEPAKDIDNGEQYLDPCRLLVQSVD
jgi:hypothetical protein